MANDSMNHYENQLYTVFKSFDVDNEEALDKSAVRELCDALQLEDRGAVLVDTLFEPPSDRVTFSQFRNGLLAVLNGSDTTCSTAISNTSPQQIQPSEIDLPSQHSDDDSSGREVAPKFVFGSKKYGRRSRPPRVTMPTDFPSPRSSSASRLDSDDKKERQRMRCRRSASAMESRNEAGSLAAGEEDIASESFEHGRRIDRDQALELCRGLNMDAIDHSLVERIFEDTGTADTTVGEFFDRLNASLSTTIEETSREEQTSGVCSDSVVEFINEEAGVGVASEMVLEMWQRAGVQQPRRLLMELGFTANKLCPPELERALDDELRSLPEPLPGNREPRNVLLAAALALSRLRLELARRRAELITAERDKLRGDVAESNKRASLLAQEVDESQARIEAELKATVRRAEARQIETARQYAAEQAAERERASATRSRLEAELARRSDVEMRLRGELNILQKRIDELECLANASEEHAIESERERTRLAAELCAVLEQNTTVAAEHNESRELSACLQDLRAENKHLRDRNDELCAALEATARSSSPRSSNVVRGGDLSAELNSLIEERSEECDSAPVSIDQRIMGHMEAITKLKQVCESIRTINLNNTNVCTSCGTITNTIRQLQERVCDINDALYVPDLPHKDAISQTDQIDNTEVLQRDLLDLNRKHDDEKRKLTSLINDLDASLEQMKLEYDKCDEYYRKKLEEERSAYNEEQRLGDERLSELIAKISEYERQFATASTNLPTIDERYSLEAQFTDLEDEFASYRRDKETELQASAAECARLVERAETLERRLAAAEAERTASPGPRRRPRDYQNPAYCAHSSDPPGVPREPTRVYVGEVRELRTRCARAETAVRRLHARLAAADVLVKELYVENCQLAQRRPL